MRNVVQDGFTSDCANVIILTLPADYHRSLHMQALKAPSNVDSDHDDNSGMMMMMIMMTTIIMI